MIKTTIFVPLVIVLITPLKVIANDQIEAIQKCLNSTEIDEFQMEQIGVELLLDDDQITRSFIVCLNDEMGFRNEEGAMQFDKIRTSLIGLTEEEVDVVIRTCEHVRGFDNSDTSYLVTKCLFKKIRSILNL